MKELLRILFSVVSSFDAKTWMYLTVAFVGLSIIVAIAKGLKKAIFLILVTGAIMSCSATSNYVKNILGVTTDGNYLYINNDNAHGNRIDLTSIDRVKLDKNGDKANISVVFKDRSKDPIKFSIDETYYDIAKTALNNLPVVVNAS